MNTPTDTNSWPHCDFELADGTLCNCPLQDLGEGIGYRCPVCVERDKRIDVERRLEIKQRFIVCVVGAYMAMYHGEPLDDLLNHIRDEGGAAMKH